MCSSDLLIYDLAFIGGLVVFSEALYVHDAIDLVYQILGSDVSHFSALRDTYGTVLLAYDQDCCVAGCAEVYSRLMTCAVGRGKLKSGFHRNLARRRVYSAVSDQYTAVVKKIREF